MVSQAQRWVASGVSMGRNRRTSNTLQLRAVNLKWPQSTKNLTPEGAPKAAETLNSSYKMESSHRPRWYIITPDAEDYDINFWGTKNVEVLKLRFGEFMQALDAAVPPLWRALPAVTDVADFPVRR